MSMRNDIMREFWRNIRASGVGCLLALLICLVLAWLASGCKPTQKIVEVEKWQHDTTTVTDTVHVTDIKWLHDSVYIKEYIKQFVQDSTRKDEAWQYTTYGPLGNITSQLNYNSTTQHGSVAHNSTESEQTSVNDSQVTHEETGSHNESSGHSEGAKEKVYVKVGLNNWQRFIMGMGYAFIIVIAFGFMFGGMRLYGKWQRR